MGFGIGDVFNPIGAVAKNVLGGSKGGGGLVNNLLGGGFMDNLLGGGKGGGPLGVFGNLAQKLFDPAGILGLGNQAQQAGTGDVAGELKEAIASLKEMIGELMAMMEGKEAPEAAGKGQAASKGDASGEMKDLFESLKEMISELMATMEDKESPQAAGAGQPININTGSGDDTVTVGAFPPPAQSTSALS